MFCSVNYYTYLCSVTFLIGGDRVDSNLPYIFLYRHKKIPLLLQGESQRMYVEQIHLELYGPTWFPEQLTPYCGGNEFI